MSDPRIAGSVRLSVSGMTCPTCEGSLQRALALVPGVRLVRADHRSSRVEVEFDFPQAEATIRRAIEEAGYDLEGIGAR